MPSQNASAIMTRFGERTGLTSSRKARRYLWTDAFAVCNFVGLARSTGEPRYAELALALVDRVHHTLGRHRSDDVRRGWISGLDENAGEGHPTAGGLRIGKDLPERQPGEPWDESLEWDRDGQYFHYSTKWMHALDQASRFGRWPQLNVWARELARASHDAFCYGTQGHRRMHWKMSIDLTRPLVPSMGQHDPLDGYVTCLQLDATAAALGAAPSPGLRDDASDFAGMLDGRALATTDPLGIGGLLTDAWRLVQLGRPGAIPEASLVEALLRAAVEGLARYGGPRGPARQRLAFRELGLAIGLEAARTWRDTGGSDGVRGFALGALHEYDSLRDEIESFWLDPEHQEGAAWTEHRDINEVMLATSLMPEGYLRLRD